MLHSDDELEERTVLLSEETMRDSLARRRAYSKREMSSEGTDVSMLALFFINVMLLAMESARSNTWMLLCSLSSRLFERL